MENLNHNQSLQRVERDTACEACSLEQCTYINHAHYQEKILRIVRNF